MSDDDAVNPRINKRDIEQLNESLESTRDSVDRLDKRIRGNGEQKSVLSRLATLETKVKGLIVGAGLLATAVVGQLVSNIL